MTLQTNGAAAALLSSGDSGSTMSWVETEASRSPRVGSPRTRLVRARRGARWLQWRVGGAGEPETAQFKLSRSSEAMAGRITLCTSTQIFFRSAGVGSLRWLNFFTMKT